MPCVFASAPFSRPRPSPREPASLAITIQGLVLPSAHAHYAWLQCSSTMLAKAQWISVGAAAANDLFFFNHMPLTLERLTISAPGDSKVAVDNHGVMGAYIHNGESKRFRASAENCIRTIPAGATGLHPSEPAGRIETLLPLGKPG